MLVGEYPVPQGEVDALELVLSGSTILLDSELLKCGMPQIQTHGDLPCKTPLHACKRYARSSSTVQMPVLSVSGF